MTEELERALSAGFFLPPPAVYRVGSVLSFYGYINGREPRENGVSSLYAEGGFLCAEGLFYDSDLYNDIRCDNGKTWLCGDTFELLFCAPGHGDYWEFHTTPGNRRTQMHIDDYRTFRNVPHEHLICDRGLVVENSFDPVRKRWHSLMKVPLESLGISDISGGSFVILRQNYSHTQEREITATQTFPETVHFPPRWPKIVAE